MRTRGLFAVLVLFVAAIGMLATAADDKPKFAIKDVMGKCMKGGLCKKVAEGKASDEEKKQLVEYFTALSQNKPPKGDPKSWEEKTKALVDAAKECVKDDKAGGPKLGKAANCKACHENHKG